jgi:ribokinase
MNKPVMLSIGAAVQDVFMSHSDAFAPVCTDPEHCFAQLPMGAKADVNQINFSTGGGAMNGATTFARQGLESIFIGQIGNDPAGQAVLADLDKESVDAQYMAFSKEYNTGYSVILLADSGERTILTYRGASTHYHIDNFQSVKNIKADWLFLSTLGGNFEVLEFLVDWASENNVKVAFNPGKGELAKPDSLRKLLPKLKILNTNKEEMSMLFDGQASDELAKAAAGTIPYVVITDGPNGAVATDGKKLVKAGMYEDVPVIDRTGAGDALISGFTSVIANGGSLEEALIFASANSTSVVGKIGAKAGILKHGAKLHDMPLETINI